MSYDLCVFYPDRRHTDEEAANLYEKLCSGETEMVTPHESIQTFYDELTAMHPEIDDIPEDRLDDKDYCPWSVAHSRSSAHVIMSCVWSRAEYVEQLVKKLADEHGLAIFDPQTGSAIYPS